MERNRIVIIIATAIVVIITFVSFIVLKKAPGSLAQEPSLDKDELIYKKVETFLRTNRHDKAIAALIMLTNQYSDSGYAEKSLRKLAAIYLKKGDETKARYYYNRLLRSFPNVPDAEKILAIVGGINMSMMQSPRITEDSIEYVVQPGDTLSGIAKKFTTTVELVKKVNGLKNDLIRLNQKLKIIVSKFSIFIDKSRNILVLKKDGEPFKTYPVSTGKDNSTPVGAFKVEEKLVKPLWYKVGAVVPPDSQEYALGERWMGISIEGYGIHGTSDETSIGAQITEGCVRMRNNDIVELFNIVPSGTEVEIVDGTN